MLDDPIVRRPEWPSKIGVPDTDTGGPPGMTDDPATAKPFGRAVKVCPATVKVGGETSWRGAYGMGIEFPLMIRFPSLPRLRYLPDTVIPLLPGVSVEPATMMLDGFAVITWPPTVRIAGSAAGGSGRLVGCGGPPFRPPIMKLASSLFG